MLGAEEDCYSPPLHPLPQQRPERHYYLTSWRTTADTLQARICAYWGIENPLHWVKDVVLGEDHSSIRARPIAAVMGLVHNLAITLFRRAGHASITAAIDQFSNDLDPLLRMTEFTSGQNKSALPDWGTHSPRHPHKSTGAIASTSSAQPQNKRSEIAPPPSTSPTKTSQSPYL